MAPSDAEVDEPLPPDRRLRRVGLGFGAVAALVVAAAIVIPAVEARATAPSGLTAASATSTVRRYVDQAVVQGNGYAACALLTPSEQAAVARLAGPGGECRAVLGGDTSFLGVSTASDLGGLRLHASVDGAATTVTATSPGGAPVTFGLAPATAADHATYDASSAPWRIARGAELVLPGGG